MNKLLKYGSYGSCIGIIGVIAQKPLMLAIGQVGTITRNFSTLSRVSGISGGAILGLIVLAATVHCVDLDSINYKKLLGWEDKNSDDDIDLVDKLEKARGEK